MRFEHFKFLMDNMFTDQQADGSFAEKYRDISAVKLPPLVLAYVGDAYFTLFVRTRLLAYQQEKVRILHNYDAKMVSASMQAIAFKELEGDLTEEESAIFRRGRNAKSSVPKSATVGEYRTSTGFEAMLGYLFLTDQYERLSEIAEKAFVSISREMTRK